MLFDFWLTLFVAFTLANNVALGALGLENFGSFCNVSHCQFVGMSKEYCAEVLRNDISWNRYCSLPSKDPLCQRTNDVENGVSRLVVPPKKQSKCFPNPENNRNPLSFPCGDQRKCTQNFRLTKFQWQVRVCKTQLFRSTIVCWTHSSPSPKHNMHCRHPGGLPARATVMTRLSPNVRLRHYSFWICGESRMIQRSTFFHSNI